MQPCPHTPKFVQTTRRAAAALRRDLSSSRCVSVCSVCRCGSRPWLAVNDCVHMDRESAQQQHIVRKAALEQSLCCFFCGLRSVLPQQQCVDDARRVFGVCRRGPLKSHTFAPKMVWSAPPDLSLFRSSKDLGPLGGEVVVLYLACSLACIVHR